MCHRMDLVFASVYVCMHLLVSIQHCVPALGEDKCTVVSSLELSSTFCYYTELEFALNDAKQRVILFIASVLIY